MAVIFQDDLVLFDSDSVAMDEACCCDSPCFCFENVIFPPCGCLSTPFGPIESIGDLTVNIMGSSCLSGPSPVGVCNTPISTPCPDIAGSYVVPCGSTIKWCIAAFICSNNFDTDYYYVSSVTISWDGTNASVFLDLAGIVVIPIGDPNPHPTLTTTGCPFAIIGTGGRQVEFRNSATLDGWQWVLGGSCREECNQVVQYRQCPSGPLTLISDVGNGNCNCAGLTVSASV